VFYKIFPLYVGIHPTNSLHSYLVLEEYAMKESAVNTPLMTLREGVAIVNVVRAEAAISASL
jgi:hypothetical protein